MCRDCGSRCAMPPAPNSIPGRRSQANRCSSRERGCRSAAGSPRPLRRVMTYRCASSPVATRSQASISGGEVARILIAEDEEPVRVLVTRALVADTHSVVATADGAEALDTLQREKGSFDLLLTDIKMPVMDGI